jgi:hypothetical protein
MKQRISLLFALLMLMGASSIAQSFSVSGKLQDSMNVKPVVFATVSLISKSDSILRTFTRTNQSGEFNLTVNKPGNYIILIAHNLFVDYVEDIELTESNKDKNLGSINMFQRGQLLKEVFIKNSAAIKIKGDTLEFLADSFKVKEGAMVEDLLKVMPGIQVNKNGEITAMGEKVEKVLVDGEEFFGDDPTVATQNIQSKVVEKVQVFDKKSDQAAFTGFDDGEEQKTINLKLKKDMNKGAFGKVELGGGWEDRWKNQAMINAFKDKRQFSVYGLMSSNGETGLGWEDRNTYTGSGGGMQMDEDGGFMWNFSSDDDDVSFGRGGTEGITKAWTGGARYANKWNENKHQLNVNYSFGRINRVKKETSFTQNLFPGNTYLTRDTANSFSSRNTHRISGKYTWNPDTSTSIIYNLNTRLSFNENESFNATHNITNNELPISSSARTNTSTSTTTRVSNNLVVNRKLNKPGRTVSLNTSYVYTNNDADGKLDGGNTYTLAGNPLSEKLDQKKVQGQLTDYFNADISYTEPIGKKFLAKVLYGYSIDGSNSEKSTLIKNSSVDETYGTRIDSLSSDFDSYVQGHTVGAELKLNEKKYNSTVGLRARYSIFHQEDLVRNLNYDYNRINLFPSLRFNYKFDQFSRLTFNYSGSTRQPSITQLQPVQDNSNPLEIYIGNPNLKIGYNQSFNVNYFNYKVLSSRSIYTGLNFSNSFNNIALNRTFDELGRTINQYVNLQGGYNATLWGGIQTKIPKTELTGKLNLNGNINHAPNIFNNVKGITNSYSITFSPGIQYNKEEKIFLDVNIGAMYNNSKSSIQRSASIQFLSFVPSASVTYYLPFNLEFNGEADYQYNPPVGPYANSFSRLLLDAGLSYRMLKNKNLTWSLSIEDMLNQNRGYERNTTNNFNTERNYMTLGRYWMAGLVWTFSTGPMAEAKKGGGGPKMPRGARGGMRMRTR